jgi:hypothetical protein
VCTRSATTRPLHKAVIATKGSERRSPGEARLPAPCAHIMGSFGLARTWSELVVYA